MDPVAAVGLLASIIQLIDATAKAVKYLNDVKNAPKERARLAREATNLLALLTDLRYRVEDAKSTDPWFAGVRSLGVKGGPLEQFDEAITALTRKLNPEKGVKKAGKSLLWTLNKKEIDRIFDEIERLKTLVSLSLQGDQFSLSQSIKKDTVQVVKGLQDKRSRDIVAWICPLNFDTKQDDFFKRHQEGTGEWLLQSHAFKDWMNATGKILWCSGLPGAGKTIITSIVVDFLERSFIREDVGIAYIYCSYKDQDNQTATNLIASLLQQLARRASVISENIKSLYEKHALNKARPSLDVFSSHLQSEVRRFSEVFIIIDALDECTEDNGTRRSFLDEIQKLQPNVHLLITSRHSATIQLGSESLTHIEIHASDRDIARYLENRIENAHRLVLHVRKDPSLENTIVRTISEKVKGMFLLAQLHMDRLAQTSCCRDVRRALHSLPKALDEVYDEAMKRIEGQAEDDAALAKRTLSRITFALKPLTVREIQHALATEPGDTDIDEYAVPDQEILISVCAGLVTIDQESQIIRLAHYTTQEYFNRTHATWIPHAQTSIATTCLTYLLFDKSAKDSYNTGDELGSRMFTYPLHRYAELHWGDHARGEPEDRVKDLVQMLILRRSNSRPANNSLTIFKHRPEVDFVFRSERQKLITGLHVVSGFGLATILRHLLKQGCQDINCRTSEEFTPLSFAAQYGQVATVRELLEHGADISAKNSHFQTALHLAARTGSEAVVKLLLEHGVDPRSRSGLRDTPLGAASLSRAALVRPIFEHGCDPDTKDFSGRTPLSHAAEQGHEAVVRLLHEYRVKCDSKDDDGRTPLLYAARQGNDAVIRLILEYGADLNFTDKFGQTPLHSAAKFGQESAVRLLLEYGADLNLTDKSGQTPLHSVAKFGPESAVRLLLEYGADLNLTDKWGQTPLRSAVVFGQESAVRLILAFSKTNVDLRITRD
ncbi:uncharacterized protein PV07_02044 [Cladophialophora immunda]|uniref:Uncharacterized protein n=1 Tax=Cladophialophora immunda TaxID=569365 RepID=A0A0D2CW65_9EURO|nr:uncharacterized protein PV07_02044 [Cladophialophora immunda]KIW35343.1 hypothetical protein PV07_02044 [Cladophialophora immunda]